MNDRMLCMASNRNNVSNIKFGNNQGFHQSSHLKIERLFLYTFSLLKNESTGTICRIRRFRQTAISVMKDKILIFVVFFLNQSPDCFSVHHCPMEDST